MELKQEKFFTEEEYEKYEHNGLAEYDDGRIILHAAPTRLHQKLVGQIHNLLYEYLKGKPCEIYMAAFNVRLRIYSTIKRVEPDISVICEKSKLTDKGCEGAPDLVIEVVSPSSKMHDYFTKVQWYKIAGVREYWIVNLMDKVITVYLFEEDEVNQYTFSQVVDVGIWNSDFGIDFNSLDLS